MQSQKEVYKPEDQEDEKSAFGDARKAIRDWVEEQHLMGTMLDILGKKIKCDRWSTFIAASLGLFWALLERSTAHPLSVLLCTLYPLYRSHLAVLNRVPADKTKWLLYWSLYGLASLCDFIALVFTPYWLLKTLLMLYLYLPPFEGAQHLYDQWLNPAWTLVSGRLDRDVLIKMHPWLLRALSIDKATMEKTSTNAVLGLLRQPVIRKLISFAVSMVTTEILEEEEEVPVQLTEVSSLASTSRNGKSESSQLLISEKDNSETNGDSVETHPQTLPASPLPRNKL